MLGNIYLPYDEFFLIAKQQLPFMGKIIAFLWIVQLVNFLCKQRLNLLGIYPRSIFGLLGIIFSPILHGSFNHLFFNTIPFFVLGMFMLGLGRNIFITATIAIAILQGLCVWLFGRRALHVGASGIISGYFGFILCLAYLYPNVVSLVLAVVAVYYFGSIIAGVLPLDDKMSWESHLSGLVAGIAVAYTLWTHPDLEPTLNKFVTNFL